MSRQFPEKPTLTYSEALAASNPRWELQELLSIAHMNWKDERMLEVAERVERAAIAELRSTILTEEAFKTPDVIRMVEIKELISEDEDDE